MGRRHRRRGLVHPLLPPPQLEGQVVQVIIEDVVPSRFSCPYRIPIATSVPLAKELDLSDGYVVTVAGLTALGLIGTGLQPALDVDLLPLGQVLVTHRCQFAVGLAAEPLDLFPLLTGRGGVGAVAGCGETGNGLAAGSVAHSGILPQVPNNNNFVHGSSPVSINCSSSLIRAWSASRS